MAGWIDNAALTLRCWPSGLGVSAAVAEGDSDIAYALFSFPSLAAYEQYRTDSMSDPECREAFRLARDTRCIRRYERRFLRPLDAVS
ncbi:NIPSNAP family protein [Streptomyces sp. AC495_CC817]|uniref:NIPSNAP family protein n=1 Tax=Streptomyces sp. AC495_CC817 TaxID=2823900 RepID=UPI001C27D2B0|nr:NIPSNAP family protein [Streptomyces sp. AC495_CC817]